MKAVEMCAGAGGQALGLEMAGFDHACLVEIDGDACVTLRLNRPDWHVFRQDLNEFDGRPYRGLELLAGGLPCPPFSRAGKQLGENDERNLFPAALRILDESKPEALMIENVKGLLDPGFETYRLFIESSVQKMGYQSSWKLLNASDFGVSQLRPRVVFVAMRSRFFDAFSWPTPHLVSPPTVGILLHDLMKENGWEGADEWAEAANSIAPTIVGGSKKHGGPDLGPTRAKNAWLKLGVNGKLVAREAPAKDFVGTPHLTVRMVARVQGFPDNWIFAGTKTNAYRQVGNAFPPPVAQAVANQIKLALELARPKMILA